jgi:trimeric autotransporter adhesin
MFCTKTNKAAQLFESRRYAKSNFCIRNVCLFIQSFLGVSMQSSNALRTIHKFSLGLIALISLTLVACGGGGGSGTSTNNPPTPAEVAAITPAQIATYSTAQIVALDTHIQYLTNPTLGAMLNTQVNAMTATEIGVLTPAQVRLIGSTGAGGATTTSKVTSLNASAWAALVGNPTQVAAITPAEIATMSLTEISALGTNIQHLSNAALGAFIAGVTFNQVGSISAAQIAVLSPAQVRFIGSTGAGGVTATSKINALNAGTWAQLVSDPLQVAAITAAEAGTLSPTEIAAMGSSLQYLSNAALGAFVTSATTFNQIGAITAAQIAVLSPAQVRFIGSTGAGGATTTAKINALNAGAWAQLVSDPLQVAAITAAETGTLSPTEIAAMGTNLQYLSNAALGALVSGTTFNQIGAITAAQIAMLSPAQVRFIGSTVGGVISTSKIAGLNAGTWVQLVSDPLQVAAITAAEIPTLASNAFAITKITGFGTNIQYLSIPATAALTAIEKAALTTAQLAAMTTAQHTACGC